MNHGDGEDYFEDLTPTVRWGLIAVVAILAMLCAGLAWGQDSRPTTRKTIPAGPVLIDLEIHRLQAFTPTQPPSDAELFATWATHTLRVLCERFEVPVPLWEVWPGPPPSADCTVARIYTPATQTIRVYAGSPPEMRRYTFLHGFLHHLHKVRGLTHEPGHDREFDRWLRVLGLIGTKR